MLATHSDTKAELNHRGQACEVLAGTGISRRRKWSEVLAHGHQGAAPPFAPAPEAGAVALRKDLLGYALMNRLPSALETASDQVAMHKHHRPCEVSVGKPPPLGKVVEHRGIAPRIPVWKTG